LTTQVVRLLREVSPIHLLFVGIPVHHEHASGALVASAAVTAHALPTYRSLLRVGVDTAMMMDGLRRGGR
jgi:hypothetical protein